MEEHAPRRHFSSGAAVQRRHIHPHTDLSWLLALLVCATTRASGCASFQSLPAYEPSTPGPTINRSLLPAAAITTATRRDADSRRAVCCTPENNCWAATRLAVARPTGVGGSKLQLNARGAQELWDGLPMPQVILQVLFRALVLSACMVEGWVDCSWDNRPRSQVGEVLNQNQGRMQPKCPSFYSIFECCNQKRCLRRG